MYGRNALIAFGTFSIFNLLALGSQKIIEIDIRKGKDDHDCLLDKPKHPCQTLDYVLNKTMHNVINLNNTDVSLLNGRYGLSYNSTFEYLQNFRLVSVESAIIYCTHYDAGIHFIFSKNITINGTTIENCGARYIPNVIYLGELVGQIYIRIGMYFEYCKNVNIVNSTFLANFGIAVGMVDVIGNVEVLSSNFMCNSDSGILNNTREKYISGGGMYIGLSGYQWDYNENTHYKIFGCQFHNNSAENNYDFIFPSETLQDDENYFGKGAGLNINILSGSYTFFINNCDFSYNTALWGAAVFAYFNGSDKNIFTIANSNFSHNNATIGGGGIRIERLILHESNSTYRNMIQLEWLNFYENHAIWGGGMSVSLTTGIDYKQETINRDVNISNCIFSRNTATVGFAIGLDTLNKNRHSVGTPMYTVFIEDSIFKENIMILTEDRLVTGQGAVYAEEVSVVLVGNNHFSKNNYTALCLDSSKLTFRKSSSSIFNSNIGTEGGAISLYGFSWMLLEKNCNISFKNNEAKRKGGAIYVRNPGPPRVAFQTTKLQISSCFLRYESDEDPDDWNVKILFENNHAPAACGNSIYASSLKYCRKSGEHRNESSAFTWKPITYMGNKNNSYEVVTDAMYVTMNSSEWNAIPDLPFDANVKLYDEKIQNVYGSLKLEIKGAVLDPPNYVFLVRKSIKRLRLQGKVLSSYTFRLMTLSGMAIETKVYNASFKICKPGYEPDKNNTKCICMSEESSSVIRCYNNGTVYILKGKWGYINKINGNKLDTIDCPEHYCRCHDEHEGYLCKFDEHSQCANSRVGILCSQCPQGKSVTFGDESCKKCSNLWLLISIPVILVLSIFSGIIFRLNIDVFSGYLNAYLYCYQMIPLLIPESITLDQFIKFVIGVTSLGGTGGNFGVCLYNGMNNLDKLFINYVIPTYVVLCTLAFGLWIPQKLWEKLFCCCRSSPDGNELYAQAQARNHSFGRALSFVLVLCYSSFTSVTLKLLHPIQYNDIFVVYDAGFQEFLSGNHLIYFIIAMLVLIVVVIGFPILLLFTHYFSKHFYTVQRAEPIFNALKNNFEDTMICRYFAAFLLHM